MYSGFIIMWHLSRLHGDSAGFYPAANINNYHENTKNKKHEKDIVYFVISNFRAFVIRIFSVLI